MYFSVLVLTIERELRLSCINMQLNRDEDGFLKSKVCAMGYDVCSILLTKAALAMASTFACMSL